MTSGHFPRDRGSDPGPLARNTSNDTSPINQILQEIENDEFHTEPVASLAQPPATKRCCLPESVRSKPRWLIISIMVTSVVVIFSLGMIFGVATKNRDDNSSYSQYSNVDEPETLEEDSPSNPPLVDSNKPSLSPTATPTVTPTATPTSSPTATPTTSPTATPTSSPTGSPFATPVSEKSTLTAQGDESTYSETSVPTGTEITTSPTEISTSSPTIYPTLTPEVTVIVENLTNTTYSYFEKNATKTYPIEIEALPQEKYEIESNLTLTTFSIISGSIPWNQTESFYTQLTTSSEEDDFQVFLGNFNDDEECLELSYATFSATLQAFSNVPVFVVPGVKDWKECPDPAEGFTLWKKYFLGFDKHWESELDVWHHKRNTENFAFVENEAMFIGLRLTANRDASSHYRTVEIINWIQEQFLANKGEFNAVYVFSDVGVTENNRAFFDFLAEEVDRLNVSVVLFYESDDPVQEQNTSLVTSKISMIPVKGGEVAFKTVRLDADGYML